MRKQIDCQFETTSKHVSKSLFVGYLIISLVLLVNYQLGLGERSHNVFAEAKFADDAMLDKDGGKVISRKRKKTTGNVATDAGPPPKVEMANRTAVADTPASRKQSRTHPRKIT